MAEIIKRRMAAEIEGDFIVFLIGMRINKFWKIHRWLPVFMVMPKMLKELAVQPELGLLGYHLHLGIRNTMLVQYWRSFDHLRKYAQSKDANHFPAWVAFNRKVGMNGDVGIWHETYCVSAGQYETVYNNMPPHGLGKVSTLIPATGRYATAAGRLGRTSGEDAPVDEAGTITVRSGTD